MGRVLLVVCCVFVGSAHGQWVLLHTDADTLVHRGIAALLNLKYDSAAADFARLRAAYPRHPAGPFFGAMVDWWHIAVDPDNTTWDAAFRAKLQSTIALCDSLLDSNGADIVALFFKGGAIGYLGELDAYREQWLAAAQQGRRGLDILNQVADLAPTNYDVMLGMGLYNYYAERIPEDYPFVKPFMLFFPSGNKTLGLQQLRAAAARARYANYEAQYQLLRVYYSYEHNYPAAYGVARDLAATFPDNALFESYLGRTQVQLGMQAAWDSVWRDVLGKHRARMPGYGIPAEREGEYYVALCAMNRQRHDEALGAFYACDSLCRILDTDGPSGFMVLTNLRIGMIYDLQRKRDIALQQYAKVLSWHDYGAAHADAERYRTRPYGQ